MPPWLAAALPFIFQGAAQIGNTVISNRSAKKQYGQMLDYNTPANQMERFKDAGLSPYLMYSQASSGNASQPAPATDIGLDKTGNIGDYIAMSNLNEDLRTKRLNNSLLVDELRHRSIKWEQQRWQNVIKEIDSAAKALNLQADYPDWHNDKHDKRQYTGHVGMTVHDSDVKQSFRRQLNQLKVAASMSQIDKIKTQIAGMRSDNVVKGVKARYAKDYGMVGGDWTQGLGLVKSLMSTLGRRKTNVIYQNQLRKQFKK